MDKTTSVDVQKLIDDADLSTTQKKAVGACLAFGFLDGFDALIPGFVLPSIAKDWEVSVASLTPMALAGVFGTIFGSMLLAPLADRVGRRPLIMFGALLFGVFNIAAAFAPNLEIMIALRLLAGLGLGAVPVTLFTYGTEMAPSRLRGTIVTLISAGLALGGLVGGFAAGFLIPVLGWRSMFALGGVLPLVLIVLMYKLLPETVQFSTLAGRSDQVARMLRQIAPSSALPPEGQAIFTLKKQPSQKSRFRSLFDGGRGPLTIVLWVLYLCQFISSFFVFSWLPSVLTEAGLDQSIAIIATSMFTLGGLGAVALGMAVDRLGGYRFWIVGGSYALGATAVSISAVSTGSLPILFVALTLAGFGIIGTGGCMNAIGASLYPAKIRTTAVGWFNGFGRVGSVVGPAIGGALLAMNLSPQSIFLVAVIPAAMCTVCAVLLGIASRHVVAESDSTQIATEATVA
ncbi:MFS transporter [Rhodococcus sp. T2V]|uniref:MFS transporter n=1 Tax=Rhodococcus sp. T2V TaxID=3034164 RepID=UPI0023E32CA7|nr:MFS transporter [Rhodococcus sp. T2V]MDF3309710.1 MFS transporter [Rhodococcus sp. T2V]